MRQLLIVDDEIFARAAVANMIKWAEYNVEVFEASSGEEALNFMMEHEVDLLMTDIRMPGMSGLELIEQINEKGIHPGIIVLSSYNEFELVRSAMQLGASDYLFKPTMMPTDILEAVLRVMKKYQEEKKHKATRIREYFYMIFQGEQKEKVSELSTEEKGLWENRDVVVVGVRLYHYQECLTQIFGDDRSLFQFSIGNVLNEILGADRGYEIFRLNHREYVVVAWKPEQDTEQQAVAEIQKSLKSGFQFLKMYYQMDAVAGISGFARGISEVFRQYTQAQELCSKANPRFQKVLLMQEGDSLGNMKREMYQAMDIIEENLGNPGLSLAMVAERIGVSKNYFSKVFKESIGVKFVDYVTRQRMEQARNLYLNSDMKIYEIAEKVGYSDWHYLYNLYKKTYGHSLSKEKDLREEKRS